MIQLRIIVIINLEDHFISHKLMILKSRKRKRRSNTILKMNN